MHKNYDTYLCRIVWRKADSRGEKFSASFLGLNDYKDEPSEQSFEQIFDKHCEDLSNSLSAYIKQKKLEEAEAFRFGKQ